MHSTPDAPAAERISAPPPAEPTLPETSPHEPTVRPWELELLISGAVVFSLIQLPAHADAWFQGLEPHMAGGANFGAFMLYAYVKLILYTLISCFVLHLCMRAYWVGLIGLETVFPQGVRWDNSSYGPVMTEVYRERIGRMQAKIDAADRFCSILFPLAFTVVMLFFFSIAVVGLAGGLAFGISRLLLGGRHMGAMLAGIFVLFAGIPLGVWALDSAFGKRAGPGQPGHRALRRASVVAYYLNAMPIVGTTFLTLFTNIRKNARYPVFYALLVVLFGVFLVKDVLLAKGALLTSSTYYLPDEEGRFGILPGHYESQRQEGAMYPRMPSIQSDVIRDPYVKLFIPYAPTRHGDAFADQCPGLPLLSRGGMRMSAADAPDSTAVRAVLDCWTRLQPVTLNGRPIRPDFRFYTHPQSGIRGILAYIPVQGLPPGENLLTVGLAPRAARDEANRRRLLGASAPEPWYIPFWL